MIGLLAAVIAISAALVGCGSNNGQSSQSSSAESSVSSTVSRVNEDADKPVGYQLDLPAEGEEIAVIDTNMGVMKMRLFPNAAPKTVENFTTLAKQGYYNGQIFHRVINNFMIQGGDPTGTGTGGENIWGTEGFEDEFNANLLNIRGSVAMANRGKNTNGSQFLLIRKKRNHLKAGIITQAYTTISVKISLPFCRHMEACPNVYRITDDVKLYTSKMAVVQHWTDIIV